MSEKKDDWSLLDTFPSRMAAEMTQKILEREGIQAIVQADDGGGLYPTLAFVSGAKLLVRNKDHAVAREILGMEEAE